MELDLGKALQVTNQRKRWWCLCIGRKLSWRHVWQQAYFWLLRSQTTNYFDHLKRTESIKVIYHWKEEIECRTNMDLVFVIGLQAAQNRAIDFTPTLFFFCHKMIVFTPRFFGPYKPTKKINISRSMARIFKNKPMLDN